MHSDGHSCAEVCHHLCNKFTPSAFCNSQYVNVHSDGHSCAEVCHHLCNKITPSDRMACNSMAAFLHGLLTSHTCSFNILEHVHTFPGHGRVSGCRLKECVPFCGRRMCSHFSFSHILSICILEHVHDSSVTLCRFPWTPHVLTHFLSSHIFFQFTSMALL